MRFTVSYTFHGRSTDVIEAENLEEATAAIEAKVESDDFEIDADEIDDVDFTIQQLHPVTRDGQELWVSFIRTGDLRGHPSALLTTPLFGSGASE